MTIYLADLDREMEHKEAFGNDFSQQLKPLLEENK